MSLLRRALSTQAVVSKIKPSAVDVRFKALNSNSTSLSALTNKVREALTDEVVPGSYYSDATVQKVLEILGKARVNPVEWSSFATFAASKYTRNVVAVDPKFVAFLLCWAPGQASAIHDHAGSSCWVKLLDGDLREQRFSMDLEKLGNDDLLPVASYMDDRHGIHRIANPNFVTPAVSLHIYAPPFQAVNVYSPNSVKTEVSFVAALGHDVQEETIDLTLADLKTDLVKGNEVAMLHRLTPSSEEMKEFASSSCFSQYRVARHLASCDENYAVVVSCFGPGQATPKYRWQHHKKRTAWHKVIRGDVRLTENGDDSKIFIEDDADDRPRQLVNVSQDDVGVLVSVYSPPLLRLLTDDDESQVLSLVSHASSCPLPAARHDVVHTNIPGLVGLLDRTFFKKKKPDVDDITALLENCTLDADEWRGYDLEKAAFDMALLADTEHYNLFLTAWRTGNFSPVHDHDGAASWTKILQGTLDEAVYDLDLNLVRAGPLAANTTTYAGPRTIHGAANTKSSPCYTLTLYSPPYRHARAYVHDESAVRRLEIPTHVCGSDHSGVSLVRPAVGSSTVFHERNI